MTDFATAKRKAARHLGFRDGDGLPDNAEIEAELRAYQGLFQNLEQRGRLAELRCLALAAMRDLEPHRCYLAGAVWNGTATRGAPITIDVFTDDGKALELSLINRAIAYTTTERGHFVRGRSARVPVLIFEMDAVEVELAVYTRNDERQALGAEAGGRADRGDATAVSALIVEQENQDGVERFLAAIR